MVSPAAVKLENVSRGFRLVLGLRDLFRRRQIRAVSDLSLEVPAGEIYGLLGPNGSGKTTTLSMILGLLRPGSGSISVMGEAPGDSTVRPRVGYLPEDFTPPEYLSGEEVLRFYGGLFGLRGKKLADRVDRYLALLQVEEARRRRFNEYSKGMRRRIGLAQALLHDPDLVILDEPTDGLDPIGVQVVNKILREARARGKTILIASHILPEVESVCDRLAILHQGALICEGTTDDLLSSDRSFVLRLADGDRSEALRAADLLASRGFPRPEVQPVRRSLESLFLEKVRRE